MQILFWRVFLSLAVCVLLPLGWGGCVAPCFGCDVPVFRYALELWPPDDYDLLVFHRGELLPEERARVEALQQRIANPAAPANCVVRTVDLERNPEDRYLRLLPNEGDLNLPWVVVLQPPIPQGSRAVWSETLSKDTLAQLVGSSTLRAIAQGLLRGEVAVWVFLESGDKAKDKAALELLQRELKQLERTLEVSTPESLAGLGTKTVPEELRASFSVVPVKRSDPSEALPVNMLLRCEPDLEEEAYASEPMAFPVYGRGRILYALVGKGITPRNIREACEFVTGPCSCEVKALNPGVDLLMAVDWQSLGGERLTDSLVLGTAQEAIPSAIQASAPQLRYTAIVLLSFAGIVIIGGLLVVKRGFGS